MTISQAPEPLRLAVIVGSTREGRAGSAIANWFVTQAGSRDDVELDVIDLVNFDFPAVYPAEPTPDMRLFTTRLDKAEAFVVVTCEYNHGYPASLKQAVDYAHEEWFAKPVGFVSYGGTGRGLRAVEQLRLVFAELHAVTTRDVVSFCLYDGSVDEHGRPRPDGADCAAQALLDQVVWWAHALRDARTARPYVA